MTSIMTQLDDIREKLGICEPWIEAGGVHWLASPSLQVRELAKGMSAVQARFVTITAYQLPGEEGFRLEYHWDLDGQLLGFPFLLTGKSIDSIFDLCEATDWIEREIHEEYAIEFLGREYEPLLLRQGDTPGVNLREEGK
jgi:hypothetical protein